MKIYFVTVFYLPSQYRDKDISNVKPSERPKGWDSICYKRSRCWGWYRDIEDARKCITENWTNIYENGYYNMAMIEPMHEGICRIAGGDEWYDAAPQVDSDGVISGYTVTKVEKPLRLKSIVGFSYA